MIMAASSDSVFRTGLHNLLGITEIQLLEWMTFIEIIISVILIPTLKAIAPPYGRHGGSKWGPTLPAKLGWFVQELPSFAFPVWYLYYVNAMPRVNVVLLMMLAIHYFQRTFIYPFFIRGGKPTPIITFASAFIFCLYNGYLQGSYHGKYAKYHTYILFHPRFPLGILMFFVGMLINIHSDHILRNLRKPGELIYRIPNGGMFEYVSCANFFGEVVEWSGYALICWSLPALAFLLFVLVNLGARSWHHHRSYIAKFEDYPKNRKALIPFIF
ncbi:PREDICTED: 3-oxo-5-alpha-steroid 4-dehydrogenase 1-like isoform X2 [Priapulus caudatus]|uniref:3-oxo-5alpha-steroid 4-dehydrogenase (NADP(+)) n=1 Tax=Priapulus caudatus TaxID=37621 RepID=A0ABM1E064_PRICU|nr:PREDICTED: 3-oxo-5-alpha-steroid 4-dehydrogenase 1-like isoform X2 [Priapulus caudatus]